MSTRPELGKLDPGQIVMVHRSANDSRGRSPGDQYVQANLINKAMGRDTR